MMSQISFTISAKCEKKKDGGNMRKLISLFLVVIFFLILNSCNYDPYSDKRPVDYGEATWICDEYDIWFCVDMEQEDYYNPEGEIQLDGDTYFCKFHFIHQTNELSISVYPIVYKDVPDDSRDRGAILADLWGECTFSADSFTLHVDKTRDTIFNGTVDELTFLRTEK